MEFDYALFRQFTVMANKPFYRLIFMIIDSHYVCKYSINVQG